MDKSRMPLLYNLKISLQEFSQSNQESPEPPFSSWVRVYRLKTAALIATSQKTFFYFTRPSDTHFPDFGCQNITATLWKLDVKQNMLPTTKTTRDSSKT